MAGVARLLVRLGGRDGVVVAIVAVIALALGGAGALLVLHAGGTTTRHVPDVAPILVDRPTDVVQISAGGNHACALRATGTVACWGSGTDGELGNGALRDSGIPVAVRGLRGVTAIATGYDDSCAIHDGGRVACWGGTDYGRIRTLDYLHRPTPVPVPGVTRAIAIGASFTNVCVVRSDGRVLCWGGALGSGRGSFVSERQTVPPGLVPGIRDAISISVGNARACAVLGTGVVACWGDGGSGQLGDRSKANALRPVRLAGIHDATAVTAGEEHTCVLRRGGDVACVGDDEAGELGDGRQGNDLASTVPVVVAGLHHVIAIGATDSNTCAVELAGSIRCWGDGAGGVNGNGGEDYEPSAVAVGRLRDARGIASGQAFQCALRANGTVVCWGADVLGQLGTGTVLGNYGPDVRIPWDPVHFPVAGT
jgi:alpha-tubulin suppressor-like RCC1 family protein